MEQPIPELIRLLLQDYLQLLAHQVPDLTEAVYLHGSILLDTFNQRLSDIDFITVLRRRPTANEIAHLKAIHQNLTATYPRWTLDGSYLQWHDLGRLPNAVAPFPYVAQGIYGTSLYWLPYKSLENGGQLRLRNFTNCLRLIGRPLPQHLRVEYELWSRKVQLGRYILNLEIYHQQLLMRSVVQNIESRKSPGRALHF